MSFNLSNDGAARPGSRCVDQFMTNEITTPVENDHPPVQSNESEAFAPIVVLDDQGKCAGDARHVANGFAVLGLAPELLAAVADLGFTQPTTVQEACIGKAMGQRRGRRTDQSGYTDLMVSSQTGSGKTAAFLLPVLQHAAQAAGRSRSPGARRQEACLRRSHRPR